MKKEIPPEPISPAAGLPPLAAAVASLRSDAAVVESLPARPTGGRAIRINWLLVLTVLLPTVLATVYYGLIASDVYISESRYVVRSPQRQPPTGLSAILQGAGFARARDDTYTVQEFILSRDALVRLEESLDLRARFGGSSVDLLHRFAGLDGDDSFEALHEYYVQRIVELATDPASSISTLRVRAHTAEDSVRINALLLQAGEALVNQLNERGRQDLIRFAEREVSAAQERAMATTLALSAYRNANAVFDPSGQSALQLQLVSKLQDELIVTQTQLAQVRSLSHQNPQIPSLEYRIRTLRDAIEAETKKVTGGRHSLSDQAAEFERLTLDREFAAQQLAAAMTSLEQARNDAMRKQLYLERIAQPSTPDSAREPRRVRAIVSVLLLGLVAWGVLAMLVAGIREHRE